MNQLTQNLRSGAMLVQEVPYPSLQKGQVLVKNHFSVISPGTEGRTVRDARLGLVSKALARQEEVKKVIQSIRTLGLKETYRLVMNRLDAPSALGYSCSGEVIAVAEDVNTLRIGDRVACAGSTAVHAEVVAIPALLCARIPQGVSMDDAAFTTLGSIAIQGIRQSELRMGEHAVVIGLGLIGQLTLELLKAGGIRAIGIDTRKDAVDFALSNGHAHCYLRTEPRLETLIGQQTGGHGTDAVIITASTSSTDPVDLAGVLSRKKGKVVIVGSVPTGFQRKNYYNKELDLRMSMSYGPGRYDPEYEQNGTDYPYAYVRWTENRNMQAFLDFLASRSINIKPLQTHAFPFQEALHAYDLILEGREFHAGILLQYDASKQARDKLILKHTHETQGPVRVGMIGAGSFAQNFLIPGLRGLVQLKGLTTSKPNLAKHIATRFGFSFCSGDPDSILNDPEINTVVIATRHDSHADLVVRSLESKKNVYTEKPLCLTLQELESIRIAYNGAGVSLMIGFNRRFAPLVQTLKNHLSSDVPCTINYRINAGPVPKEHWIHHPQTGGGRLLGEACHFIDLCSYLTGSAISKVSAQAMKDSAGLNDTFNVQLVFENGSIASISYFSNGNPSISKERIEVFNGGVTGILDDFMDLRLHTGEKNKHFRSKQDKGHRQLLRCWSGCLTNGNASPIPFDEIHNSTLATILANESLKSTGDTIALSTHG